MIRILFRLFVYKYLHNTSSGRPGTGVKRNLVRRLSTISKYIYDASLQYIQSRIVNNS